MRRNVEVKAQLADADTFARRAAALAGGPARTIGQRDTFFRTASGRLKLRELADGTGELIYYERPDARGPKASRYLIAGTHEPAQLRELLGRLFEVRATVSKERRLFLHGQTRIHVDRVEGLGDFMELEVVLTERQTPVDGRRIAEDLLRALGVEPSQLVEGAYVDLLERAGAALRAGTRTAP